VSDALELPTMSAAIAKWVRNGSGLDENHVFWSYEKKPRPTAPYIEMTLQQVRGIGHDWVTSATNQLEFDPLVVSTVTPAADTLTIAAHGLANGDGPVRLLGAALPAPLAQGVDYWVVFVDVNTIKLATSYVRTGGQMPLGAGNPVTPIDLTTAGSGSIQVVATVDTVPAGREIARTAQGFREITVHLECIALDGKGYDAVRLMSNVVAAIQLNLYDLDQAGVGVSDLGSAFSQGGVQHLEGRRGGLLEPRAMFDFVFYAASNLTGFETIIETIDASIVLDSDGGTPLPAIPVHITRS
jgi:hypothetical protein